MTNTTEAALRDALAEVFADCHKISSAEWYNKAAAALSQPSPASSTAQEDDPIVAHQRAEWEKEIDQIRGSDLGSRTLRLSRYLQGFSGAYQWTRCTPHGDFCYLLDHTPLSPSSGEPAQTDDPLQSYEKFDGVGPHNETVETRAMIGERFLECYESALDDPLLKGYVPADCPSEIVLNLLERLREAGEPASVAPTLAAAVERFLADYDDGDRADAGTNPLMEAHIADLRAALHSPMSELQAWGQEFEAGDAWRKHYDAMAKAAGELKAAIRPQLDAMPYADHAKVRKAFNDIAVVAGRALDFLQGRPLPSAPSGEIEK